ncbi:unnamed protein product [Rotaria sp. Silwood1]|nr:unnamed protein product [Rotaria sp. Silwood1]
MYSKSHQCSICKKSFSRPSKLQYHIAYHHEKKFSFECIQCGKPYSNQDHVNRHYRTVHQQENTTTKNKIHQDEFICQHPNCGKRFLYMRNLRHHIKIHHENISRLSCPMNSCSKTFTCQASICRHLSKCHSSNDIIEQINIRQKQSHHRKSNIQSLLSGFNSRKLNQENEISKQMKYLLKLLLTEDNRVQIPDENMDITINDNSFDQDLLNGYRDIGLVEL